MDPLELFRNETESILGSILGKKGIDHRPEFGDAPKGLGDAAFPCFPLAKVLKMAPVKIAEELAEECKAHLRRSDFRLIEKVEAAKGYLNFYYNEKELMRLTLRAIDEMGRDYGKGKQRKERIILEHTSANPNGPFHVGRARNPIIGDTLARILRFAGCDIVTEYYVNDMGKQAVILAWGIDNLKGKVEKGKGKNDHRLVPFYQRASALMNENPDVLEEINAMLKRYEKGDRKIGKEVQHYCSLILEGMKHTLREMNILLDNYVFESRYVYNRDVTGVIEKLRQSDYSREEHGAYYLELEDFGIQGRETRFFYTRKDGTSLYTTRDLAYHLDKLRRGDRVIDVLGEDHRLQARQLAIALGELGEEKKPEVIFYAFVSLPEGKMSTRRGRVVYLDNLIEEALERAYKEVHKRRPDLSEEDKRRIAKIVGIGAIRYNIIRVQMEKSMVFRWEDALNFEGDSAPFIQYTHARASSILRKAGDEGSVLKEEAAGYLLDPNELALIRALARFPGLVQECAYRLKIHTMASYLRETARLFNQFYRECPVLTAPEGEREARLLLVRAFRSVIATGLGLLGIEAPEFM